MISVSEYATHRQVTVKAVVDAIRAGRLKRSIHPTGKIISVSMADKEWELNTNPFWRMNAQGAAAYSPGKEELQPVVAARGFPQSEPTLPPTRIVSMIDDDDGDPDDLDEEDAARSKNPALREKHWKAETARLKFREASGELAPVSEMASKWATYVLNCRGKLLNVPGKAKLIFPDLTVDLMTGLEFLISDALTELIVTPKKENHADERTADT